MVILGVWDGTPASAALVVDGKLVCAVAEERLSRVKNAYGYPENAINAVLRAANLEIKDIDRVAMSTKSLLPMYFYTQRNAKFSVKDYWKEQNDYWFPRLYKGENPSYLDIFRDKIDTASFPYDEKLISNERDAEGMWKARLAHVCASLNVRETKLLFLITMLVMLITAFCYLQIRMRRLWCLPWMDMAITPMPRYLSVNRLPNSKFYHDRRISIWDGCIVTLPYFWE